MILEHTLSLFLLEKNNVTFSISIYDDNIYEYSEIFNLAIDESSLPNGVTSGIPNVTTVTLLDNDCK